MVRFESPPKVNLVREDAGYPIVSEPLHHFLNLGVLPNATNRFDRFAHPLSPWWRRDASELAAQPKLGLWSKWRNESHQHHHCGAAHFVIHETNLERSYDALSLV